MGNFFERNLFKVAMYAIVALVLLMVYVAYQDERHFKQYVVTHHCAVAGHVAGTDAISTSGHVVYIPGKTIYHCDNDDTEIR